MALGCPRDLKAKQGKLPTALIGKLTNGLVDAVQLPPQLVVLMTSCISSSSFQPVLDIALCLNKFV